MTPEQISQKRYDKRMRKEKMALMVYSRPVKVLLFPLSVIKKVLRFLQACWKAA